MVMQVTPGFGTSVATELKGNAHHQRVITHSDIVRARVNPAVSAATYTPGQCIGGEMTFAGVARLVGDVAQVEAVQVTLANLSVAGDMDLVLYPDVLTDSPVNGQPFTLTDVDLRDVQAVIRINAADFQQIGGQQFAIVTPFTPTFLRAAGGVSSMRGALVAAGGVAPDSSDSLTITLIVRRS